MLLLILIAICLSRINAHSDTLQSQQAATAWKGESPQRFAQVTTFFPLGNELSEDSVMMFRAGLDSKLEDSGEEIPEGSSLWTDAYSGTTAAKVKGTRSSADVSVLAVGGNFFSFHPYELISGSYLYENDLMEDRVVLEYDLAWTLFGGTDLAGMTVTIDDKPYYIAGVVRREQDSFSQRAFTGDALMFISYAGASKLDENLKINCYELVMADPISSFVENIVNEEFSKVKGVTVENSTRYDFGKIYNIFKDFGSRSIADNGIAYPYWENAARISEVYVARLYVVIALLGVIPLACLVWLGVLLVKFIIAKLNQAAAAGKEAWEDRYARIESFEEKRAQRKRRRKEPRRSGVKSGEPEPPAESDIFNEEKVTLDIESIVKEILDENK